MPGISDLLLVIDHQLADAAQVLIAQLVVASSMSGSIHNFASPSGD
jgi:hypothetical protein